MGLFDFLGINAAELAWFQHLEEEELERQTRVIIARELYEGHTDADLIDELDEIMLGSSDLVNNLFNAYAGVVDEVLDRLIAADLFNTPSPRPGFEDDGERVDWAMQWWQEQRMDTKQHELFERALVDGEAFIMLQPRPQEDGSVAIVPHVRKRYTSADAGAAGLVGDNEGVKVHYSPTEPDVVTMISYRWIETYWDGDESDQRNRLTLYIAGTADTDQGPGEVARIEKYEIVQNEPVEFQDEGDPGWPLWWTDNGQESGTSLPLPVIHFPSAKGKPAAQGAQGAQVMLDELYTLALSTAMAQTYPMLAVIGGHPTTDGKPPDSTQSNVWKIGPRQLIGFPEKLPEDAVVKRIDPGDIKQILLAVDRTWITTAVANKAPSLAADQLALRATSAEFLKQLDSGPMARTRREQSALGDAFTRLFETLVILNNSFPGGETYPEESPVHVRWLPADIRGIHRESPEDIVEVEEGSEATADTDASGEAPPENSS